MSNTPNSTTQGTRNIGAQNIVDMLAAAAGKAQGEVSDMADAVVFLGGLAFKQNLVKAVMSEGSPLERRATCPLAKRKARSFTSGPPNPKLSWFWANGCAAFC